VQKQNFSLHTSLSRVPSSLISLLVILRLTPSVHLSLRPPYLRIPCSSHSRVLRGNLFSVIRRTYPNHRYRFSSVSTDMVFSPSVIVRVLCGKVLFLDFLAGRLQKSIPVRSSLLACYVFQYIYICSQPDATSHSLFMSGNCCTCFGWYLHPSSGAHTTIYSIWYLSHRYCYLPLSWRSWMKSGGTTRNM
jgi:hypothetical protein